MLCRSIGGKGAVDLGQAIVDSCSKMRSLGSPFKFLYPLELGIAEKFEVICSKCPHKARNVKEYSDLLLQRKSMVL
jgi:formyltetrahydrofolate synthetase